MTLTDDQKRFFVANGFLKVPGLLPPDLIASTKADLLAAMGIDERDPATWEGKPGLSPEEHVRETTYAARTDAFESVVEQLVGPDFLRGVCYSPYLEWNHVSPVMTRGYIPVLSFPKPGPPEFVEPGGYHIDGGESIRAWPGVNFLAVMAYLTDTKPYGGATVVKPGSHRQVFERWLTDTTGAPAPPPLDYAPSTPIEASAGDVVFMHYLLVHSGSANFDDHIRVGMNTAVMPHPARPYRPKSGPPQPDWTPMDYTLRTDTLE